MKPSASYSLSIQPVAVQTLGSNLAYLMLKVNPGGAAKSRQQNTDSVQLFHLNNDEGLVEFLRSALESRRVAV